MEIHETFSKWGYPDNHDDIARKVAQLLAKLRAEEPQLDLNGQDNIWIVKPACTVLLKQSYRVDEESSVSASLTTSWIMVLASKHNTSCKSTSKIP